MSEAFVNQAYKFYEEKCPAKTQLEIAKKERAVIKTSIGEIANNINWTVFKIMLGIIGLLGSTVIGLIVYIWNVLMPNMNKLAQVLDKLGGP